MKFKTIPEVFNHHIPDLKIDKDFMKSISRFRLGWINRSANHIDFLSSHLTGVHPIRFTPQDEENFYNIFDIDLRSLTTDLHNLKDVYEERIVSSNPFYILISYLLHKTTVSKLSEKDKERTKTDLFSIMAYKMMSSIYVNYFSYDADVDIATITYEKLSRRFILKKLGNWQSFIDYRALDVNKKGLHDKALHRFDTYDALYVITDTQTKLKSTMNEIYVVMMRVIEDNEKRHSKSLFETDGEGQESIRESVNLHQELYTFLKSVVFNERELINDDLIEVSIEIFKNITEKDARVALKALSELALEEPEYVEELIETTLKASIGYLYLDKLYPPYLKNTVAIMKHLKGYYSSSKVKNEDVLKSKKMMLKVVTKATKRKTKWLTISITNTLLIYLFMRAVIGTSKK